MTVDEALAAVNKALTGPERNKIAADFARVNPDYADCNADDVLALMWQHDAYLEVREPFAEANPDLFARGDAAASFALLAVIRLGWPVTRLNVVRLLHRAGLVRTLGRADVAALAAQQRAHAEEKQGLAAIAGEIGAAVLADALHDLAREELRLAAKLEALAAAQYDPPATS